MKRPLLWVDVLGFGADITRSDNDLEKSMLDYEHLINRFLDTFSAVNFDIVSDSLLFWSKENKELKRELSTICEAAHLFLHNSLMYPAKSKHTLIRGSIVIDEFYIGMKEHSVSHQIYKNGKPSRIEHRSLNYHLLLGKAIVHAHKWEGMQNWCLISFDPRYNELLEQSGTISEYVLRNNILIKTSIPTKNGSCEGYVVNPFMMEYCVGCRKKFEIDSDGKHSDNYSLERVENYYFEHLNSKLNAAHPSDKDKIQNTINFYDYVISKKLYVKGLYSPDE